MGRFDGMSETANVVEERVQLFGVVVVGRGRQKQLLVETWT
jgi:hypothetical protein